MHNLTLIQFGGKKEFSQERPKFDKEEIEKLRYFLDCFSR